MNNFSSLSEKIDFKSDFPEILKDCALENIEQYIMTQNRYISLFEPLKNEKILIIKKKQPKKQEIKEILNNEKAKHL